MKTQHTLNFINSLIIGQIVGMITLFGTLAHARSGDVNYLCYVGPAGKYETRNQVPYDEMTFLTFRKNGRLRYYFNKPDQEQSTTRFVTSIDGKTYSAIETVESSGFREVAFIEYSNRFIDGKTGTIARIYRSLSKTIDRTEFHCFQYDASVGIYD